MGPARSCHVVLAVLTLLASLPCDAWKLWSKDGPSKRRGHSLVVHRNHVVLFGGRGDDVNVFHQPKTFEMVSNDGKLEFSTYESKPVPLVSKERTELVSGDPFVEQCLERIEADPATPILGNPRCNYNGTLRPELQRDFYIPVGVFHNDLWWYNLACDRVADEPCLHEGWQVLDAGASLGGCYLSEGNEVCTHPSERYAQQMVAVDGTYALMFGGYSHSCEDYCEDAWLFLFPTDQEGWQSPGDGWVQLQTATSPGKRWKASAVLVDNSVLFLFGGHRLWHGMSGENSRENRYELHNTYPKGGYLSDLWKWDMSACRLSKEQEALSLQGKRSILRSCLVQWEELSSKQNCTSTTTRNRDMIPGNAWKTRHETKCFTVWPVSRAGHSMVYHQGNLYLYGGYRVSYPYPSSDGLGSGPGTLRASDATSFMPSRFSYFLSDLWKYDIASGYWHAITPLSKRSPSPRTEHSLASVADALVLFGGYNSNFHNNEFWLFNTSTSRWLEKTNFVHPKYPGSCRAGEIVPAIPTLGTTLDGEFGRSNEHVLYDVVRRRAPGWDGCRDRADERTDLPWKLQWEQPSQRSHHAVTFSEAYNSLLLFGGHGYLEEHLDEKSISRPVGANSEFWVYHFDQCMNNCSGRGTCHFGFCSCDSGYYGYDCSNTSCPGDFCYYDETSWEQVCTHCCHAPYRHTDSDVYIPDYGKESCSRASTGESHGICDGYGKCLCAPSFVGLDCAIKGCIDDCSGNGYCSEEYPVSRCVCDLGYTGSVCEIKECLNNCSYPNGICEGGTCKCRDILDPYNRSRVWRKYEGEDCSFVIPYAGCSAPRAPLLSLAAVLVLVSSKP